MNLKKNIVIFCIFFASFPYLCFSGVAKVAGKVTDAEGKGLGKVTITLTPERSDYLNLKAKSKRNGDYFFGMVKPANYTFSASKEGYVLYEAEIIIMSEDKKIKETAKGRLPLDEPPPPMGVGSDDNITLNLTMKKRSEVEKEVADLQLPEVLSLLNAGNFQKALDLTGDILSKDPKNAAAYYLQGNAYYELKENQKAVDSLQKALELNPDQEGAHFLLGKIYYDSKDEIKCTEEFKKELEISKENKEIRSLTLLNLGILYSFQKNYKQAAKVFEEAIELKPDEIAAYSELANIYTNLNEPEKAEKVMNRIKEIGTENPDIYYNLGVNYYNSKNYEKSAEEFQKVIDIKADYANAHKFLGFSFLNLGQREKALIYLKKYLELNQDAPDIIEIKQIIESLEKD